MTNIAVPPATGQPTGTGETGTQVDGAKYAELETKFNNLSHQLNGISAALRAQSKVTAQPKAEDAAPTQDQAVTLKGLKAELEARDTRIRSKAINTEVRAFAKNAGISEDAVPFFAAYVKEMFGGKLTTNDQDAVVYTDELGDVKPFEHIGKQILASPGGRTFLPPVATPGAVGNRTRNGVNGSQGQVLPDTSQMNQAQLAEWMIQNPAQADELMRQKAMGLGMIRT